MSVIFRSIITAIMFLFATDALAERVEVKAMGTYQYTGSFFSADKPTDAERQAALSSAKQNAWKAYVAGLNSSQQKIIGENEKNVTGKIDDFIIESVVLDVSKDSNLKTLNVLARVAFDSGKVSLLLQSLSVGQGSNKANQAKSSFAFLFVARRQTSAKAFDARRTDVSKLDTATTVADDGAVSKERVSASGGNTLKKEDEVTYDVSSNQDFNTAVSEILTTSGIDTYSYEDVVGYCQAPAPDTFLGVFAKTDELDIKTRKAVVDGIRSCDDIKFKYFAVGVVDSHLAFTDSVSGRPRVEVSVRVQLYEIASQKIPRLVGSVGPKQYSGLGTDSSIATKNALSSVAKALGRELVDQLNAQGIR